MLLWARMPQTIVAEIRPGRRVVGLVTLGAIGRIGAARNVAGVPVVTGVPVVVTGVPVVVAGVPVVVVIIIISVVVAAVIVGVIVAPVAITQRATGR